MGKSISNDPNSFQEKKLIPQCLHHLAAKSVWVRMKLTYNQDTEKWEKMPFSCVQGHTYASHSNPETWGTLKQVHAAIKASSEKSCAAIACLGTPLLTIDLDNCIDPSGELSDTAKRVLELCKGAYHERTVSGNGIHVYGAGSVDDEREKTEGIEIYGEESKRFICVYNRPVGNKHAPLVDLSFASRQIKEEFFRKPHKKKDVVSCPFSDQQIINKASDGGNKEKFLRLFLRGDIHGYASHSEADLALMSLLAFWTQDTEQLIRLFHLSALSRDKSYREDYLSKLIQKALSGAHRFYLGNPKEEEDDELEKLLERLNEEYAFVTKNPKYTIVRFCDDGDLLLLSKSEFLLGLENVRYKNKNIGVFWLRWKKMRMIKKFVFDASKPPRAYEEGGHEYVNFWKGLALEPQEGDCSIIVDHFRNVICSGNEEFFNTLMNLLAVWVQKPWEQTFSPVLISAEGMGKGVFNELFSRIFGSAFVSSSSHENVFGHFNGLISEKIIVELSEAMFGGNKNLSGRVKAAITDPTIEITFKGRDPIEINNQKKFIIISNEPFAVPTGAASRRFWFIDIVGEVQSREYFKRLYDFIKKGKGAAYFLNYLLNRNIEGFEFKYIPSRVSSHGIINKVSVLSTLERFLLEAFEEECFDTTGDVGENYWKDDGIACERFRKCYFSWCKKHNERHLLHSRVAGEMLHKIFGKKIKKKIQKNRERKTYYEFGDLESARKKLLNYTKLPDDFFD